MTNAYIPRFRLLFLCFTLIFAWTAVPAQVRTINGLIIRDSDKQPVPGVTIRVKGANTGTSTDDKGRYSLANVPANATLVFTAIGFQTQELPVNGRQQINISLAESSKGLNEVLVVGYGTQKKGDLTGAIASVNGAELNRRIATDPVQLLQGKLPGLSLTQGSGEAGNEGSVLRVRGLGTYSSAGSSPLVIVDGLPGSLTVLDPQNIESVTLLKDAASAAIYGTRAANGVILVTTRQGKSGKFQLSYDYSFGITKPTALPDNLIYNSAKYMQMWNVAAANSGYKNLFTPEMIAAYTNPSDPERYPDFNWLDAVMRTVQVHTHHIGMTGGSNGTVYNIGIGYVDQPDIMIGFSYKKYNLQFNLNSKINDWATFGSSVTLNYGKRTYASRGSQDMFLSTLSQSPMYGPKLPDGSGRYVNSVYPSVQTPNKNPVAIAENALVNSNDYFLQSSLFLNIRLLKGLEWRTSGGLNFNFNKVYDFKPVINQYNWFAKLNDPFERTLDVNGQGLVVTDSNMVYPVGYTQLTYSKAINKHNFKLLAGTQAEYNKAQRLVASRNTPFPSNSLHELNAGPAGSQIATGTTSEWALRSYYGRLNYDYDEKYLLEVNARYDASSRFPPDNRWGLFPSVSAGWVLTREQFLHNIAWLNNLKLRGSWGKLGNQNIGNYPYQDVYTTSNAYNPNTGYAYSFSGNTLNSGVGQNGLVDRNIKWETTRIFDFGADVALFNKLDVTVDWYNKLTYDILYTPLIPAYLGLNAPTLNQGKMKNTGLEASFQYTDKIGSVRFSVGGTFQTNKNRVIRFGAASINTGNNTIIQEGQPYGSFYMYEYAGIFQSADEVARSPIQQYNPKPGYLKFKDVTGNDTVNASDRVIVPGVFPKFDYGFNASTSWKNFDVSVFLYGSYGQKLFVNGWGVQPFNQGSPPTTDWLNAWTPEHPSTTMPLIYITGQGDASSNISTASTYYLKGASFLRLKNVQLGYTLPASLVKRVSLSSLRIFFAGDNLFTITGFKGLDPERVSNNTRFVSHPQNQVFAFGIKAAF
ncbi:SusC/RagA family TonB-linked outer membrane protein [Chitinophaga ginsengisoli]|uniref:TonB-linked SusC/RagA family outer membrane protein n=1 Tax=Chitinophaga ginsengisoli TaxID=363837 RepID=A0A2P8FXG1_9BACT|nr:TonB-dependent receptor [Chitinophaga ginsengisoli]PSL26404.1 TonB-linked SusC/RagA family outer membrane protein [Chitinophaga ginsengisoli]